MSQTIFITGANKGIGLSFVKKYLGNASAGDRVIAATRKPLKDCPELAQVFKKQKEIHREVKTKDGHKEPILIHVELDVASVQSIKQLPSQLMAKGVESISLLINNAGVLQRDEGIESENQSLESLAQSMAHHHTTNAIGPVLVTKALVNFLKPNSKVVNVTSRMGSIEDNTSGAYYGYRCSKAAVNMLTKSMAVDLKSRKIAVGCVHPGFVATDMTGGNGSLAPERTSLAISNWKLLAPFGIVPEDLFLIKSAAMCYPLASFVGAYLSNKLPEVLSLPKHLNALKDARRNYI